MNFDLFGRSSQGERELFLFVILEIQNIQYKFWDEKSIKCLARYFFFAVKKKVLDFTCICIHVYSIQSSPIQEVQIV